MTKLNSELDSLQQEFSEMPRQELTAQQRKEFRQLMDRNTDLHFPSPDASLDSLILEKAASDIAPPLSSHWKEYESTAISALNGVTLIVVGWVILAHLLRKIIQRLESQVDQLKSQMDRVNERQRITASAANSWDSTKPLLQQRDRLLRLYGFTLSLSTAEFDAWRKLMWKEYAYCTLNLIRSVRPLTFQDYRLRVLATSPTYEPPARRVDTDVYFTEVEWTESQSAGLEIIPILAVEPTQRPPRPLLYQDLESVITSINPKPSIS